jgi:hypothetical protein
MGLNDAVSVPLSPGTFAARWNQSKNPATRTVSLSTTHAVIAQPQDGFCFAIRLVG